MTKLVIANRGEIARRILRAARTKGFSVAVISTEADQHSLVCTEADHVLLVSSFLDGEAIVAQASKWGANLLHPGYGFLSENAGFAEQLELSGIGFVGPTAESMRLMGGKESAKKVAASCGVPTLEAVLSHELAAAPESKWPDLLAERGVKAPFLVKASGGGGGKGMRVVENFADLPTQVKRASEEALLGFNDPTVFVERYLAKPRHIEIQVFGDGKGGGVHLGERECSLQRRHQKVFEEAPSSVVSPELRDTMGAAALRLVKSCKYRGAGTVEFLLDSHGQFFFLEMNTRLQVEHPVTEWVYGVDLVLAQFDLALGKWPSALADAHSPKCPVPNGVCFEARILAEDASVGFVPTPGPIRLYQEPSGEGVRVDTGVKTGSVVSSEFDSMIAKLIVWGSSRDEAVSRLQSALSKFVIQGCTNNLGFLGACARHSDFRSGNFDTDWIGRNIELLNAPLLSESLLKLLKSPPLQEEILKKSLQSAGSSSHVSAQLGAEGPLGAQPSDLFAEAPFPSATQVRVEPGAHQGQCFLSGPGIESCAGLGLQKSSLEVWVSRKDVTHFQMSLLGVTLSFEVPWLARKETGTLSDESLELRAPMAGKVHAVFVKEGDQLLEGQVAFVVESMKMQLEVRAAREGRVAEIFVSVGQSLSGPDVLAKLV